MSTAVMAIVAPRFVVPALAPIPPGAFVAVGRRGFIAATLPHGTGRIAVEQIGRGGPMNSQVVSDQRARFEVVMVPSGGEAALRATDAAVGQVLIGSPVVHRAIAPGGSESQGESDRSN